MVDAYAIEIEDKDGVFHCGTDIGTIAGCRYRFVSLYNGMRGTWYTNKEDAVRQGKRHKRILESMIRETL